MSGALIADAALALTGTPFRLHGRDPRFGLDCVGLVWRALHDAGFAVVAPTGYMLRTTELRPLLAFAPAAGLSPCSGPIQPGDILLVRPGPAQHHLVIAGPDHRREGEWIHAHAGLRKVVATSGPLAWPAAKHWRHISAF